MPNPVFSYRWWEAQRKRTELEWQQGRSLLLFAAAATAFPVGAASTELPPARVATPVAVGWQSPNNRVLQPTATALPVGAANTNSLAPQQPTRPALTFTSSGTPTPQVVTIPSAAWTALPPPPPWFRAAPTAGIPIPSPLLVAIPSGRSLELPPRPVQFRQADTAGILLASQAAIIGQRWTDIPTRSALFWPADNWSAPLRFLKPTLRSAQNADMPARAPAFRAADLQQAAIPAPAAAALPSARQLELPVVRPPFAAADVHNALLPRYETFTGFAPGQQLSPVPTRPPWVDRGYAKPPFALVSLPPGNMPSVIGMNWIQATETLIRSGIAPNDGIVPGSVYANVAYFGAWPVSLVWIKTTAAPPGFVIGQSPAAGSSVLFNSSVTLTVSSFPLAVSDRFTAGGYNA